MTRTATGALGRRSFLVQASKGVLGFVVLGLAAACSPDDDADGDRPSCGRGSTAGLEWRGVYFAYVSAYVLVRGREAALVDCGFGSRVDDIAAVLRATGTGWDRVRHVVVTHSHPDHVGGFVEIAAAAPRAALYVGTAEVESLPPAAWSGRSPRWPVRPVTDGQEVFGAEVVETPGHTPGHIAVFDADSRVLVAGDALTSTVTGLAGPVPESTRDMPTAEESVRRLAALAPEVILVGHGPPVRCDAAAQLRGLAGSSLR